jgi:hypothetical protein
MKRWFLIGLGSLAIVLGAIAVPFHGHDSTVIATMAALVAGGLWAIRQALDMQPRKSRGEAVVGWFCGFFVVGVVIFGYVGAAMMLRRLVA